MLKIKAFAWNMQRGSSIIPPKSPADSKLKAEARGHLLAALCAAHDIGFVTEPGNDLINAVSAPNATSNLLPNGYGFWNCSNEADGQMGTHDCKNLIYSVFQLTPVEVGYSSGSDDCYRWPAAGTFHQVNEAKVLLITLHATSGGGGWENAKGVFDYLDGKLKDRHKCRVVLVGGDMNSNHSFFRMPTVSTHQSGHVLDGFASDQYDYYEGCSDPDADVDASFLIATAIALPSTSGKLVTASGSTPLGYYYKYQGDWVRVSDHAPVRTDLTITLEQTDSDMDF